MANKKLGIQSSPLTRRHWAPLIYGGYSHPSPLKGIGATYTYPGYTLQQCRTTLDTLPGTVSWYWNWGLKSYQVAGDIEFVPCVYSAASIGQQPDGNSPYLLTYNEPRGPPENYVDTWIHCAEIYNTHRVFMPSVWELSWLDKFYAELARRRREDLAYGISFHIYEHAPSAALLALQRVGQRADAWGCDVWITEYAFDPCWDGGLPWAVQVMQGVAAECERRGWRYAWFQHSFPNGVPWWHGCNTSLYDYQTGARTPLGEAYRSV
jgi:hypothetical protein